MMHRARLVMIASSALLVSVITVTGAVTGGAAGNPLVNSYVMHDPAKGGSALPPSALLPYLSKVEKALLPFAATTGVAKVALDGWTSTKDGIQVVVELSAFTQPIVDSSTQAIEAVRASCQSATEVTPKRVSSLTSISGSVEAQCTTKEGVRLLTSVSWVRANVLALVIVSGTTRRQAERWSVVQAKLIPHDGFATEVATSTSTKYRASTDPLFASYNNWLTKFHAWAAVNGTAAQAAVFDRPLVAQLHASSTSLAATSWPNNAAHSIAALERAIQVIAKQLTNLALVTPTSAAAWGKVFTVDQQGLFRALTTAQGSTAH